MASWDPLEGKLGASWAVLRPLGAVSERSWAVSGPLGQSWGPLGTFVTPLGALWSHATGPEKSGNLGAGLVKEQLQYSTQRNRSHLRTLHYVSSGTVGGGFLLVVPSRSPQDTLQGIPSSTALCWPRRLAGQQLLSEPRCELWTVPRSSWVKPRSQPQWQR